ncbi:MAG: hypothetical protein GY694_06470 [Gammaproteobacteria bacterium]|nr:hypothetical protein [Gammaproteobacteria bacterium]
MKNSLFDKLCDLESETLAKALFQLAEHNKIAQDVVENLVATETENIKRFKSKITGLKRRSRFIDWRESSSFANDLSMLLQNLKEGINDPCIGAKLVLKFFKTDDNIMNICDDSDGSIGDVYRYEASDLFKYYAQSCQNKKKLSKALFELSKVDDFGLRDSLFENSSHFLPIPQLKTMASGYWSLMEQETEDYKKRHWGLLIELLAKELKDPLLFEKARRYTWPDLTTATRKDIATIWLDSGQPDKALEWLNQIDKSETYMSAERNTLLLTIYGQLGNTQQQEQIAWEIFRSYRSLETLNDLLNIIGEEQREQVIAKEAELLQNDNELSISHAHFLIDMGYIDLAESYIFKRKEQLNGEYYYTLPNLAKVMEKNEKYLVATIILRSLLNSIFERAKSKTYPHGIRYLKTLDKLANRVSDWRDISTHSDYFNEIKKNNSRKSSFWSKYD